MNAQRLLERFLGYVGIDTTSVEGVADYPSSPGQLQLGQRVAEELRQLGLPEVEQDSHGLVWATLPSNGSPAGPTIAFLAHLDTSPEAPGGPVRAQVIECYQGGEIPLPGDRSKILRPEENPELQRMVGKTLITSDGTTLLGADDKTGVAILVETVAHLVENPHIRHGPIRLLFTCDEEIGRGVDFVDLQRLGATVAYTLDGTGAYSIDVETFSADQAVITITGRNIHPSIAKGRMVNALRVVGELLCRFPLDHLSPESTEGRQGFIHPYWVEGGVGKVVLRVLLRDFQTSQLAEYARLLYEAAAEAQALFPGSSIEVAITPQYRNMAEGLAKHPQAVALAQKALERLGRRPRLTFVRGGTDGARLTAMGLPTPNLATGQYNPHSVLEWACLDEMIDTVAWLVSLAELWAFPEADGQGQNTHSR
ncbi:MAG: peptidase T [Thermoguttaceae bacterium]|nr:peptidase T [Thermoguttaceae bacterium]MDW8037636.1 peptidase T [Thermoguttaceae bacterium]